MFDLCSPRFTMIASGSVCASCCRLCNTQTANVRDIASLPLVLGGLGLRCAHWARWADCIPMMFECHRAVAERLSRELEGVPTTPCLHAAAFAGQSLDGELGWSPTSWTALANGERPESRPPEEFVPGARRGGWQHEAASREDLFALLHGSGASSVPGRTWSKSRSDHMPTVPCDIPALSSAASAPLAPPSSLDRTSLPVWPPTRLTWPPPCKLHAGGGSWGGAGIRWKASWPGSVGKLEDESPQTSSYETSTSQIRLREMAGDWR